MIPSLVLLPLFMGISPSFKCSWLSRRRCSAPVLLLSTEPLESLMRSSPTFRDVASVDKAMIEAKKGNWEQACDLFRQCCLRPDGNPHVRDCNRFIKVLGDAGKLSEATDAFNSMLLGGIEPTVVTYSTLISRYGACANASMAEKFYNQMIDSGIRPDAPAMNSLINAFAKVGAVNKSVEVFKEMKRFDVKPTIITFNSLLDACVRARNTALASKIFSYIAEWQLKPDERTYSILIQSRVACNDLDGSFEVYDRMKGEGVDANAFTFSTLINGCLKAGEFDRAFNTLREMIGCGIEPNVVTWTSVIHGCAKHNRIEAGFRLFREMMIRGVPPNNVTCSALMDGCLKHGEVDLAFAVLQYMLDNCIEPTKVTYTSLLTECARLGRADRAAQILGEMRRAQRAPRDTNSQEGGAVSKADLDRRLLVLFGEAKKVNEAVEIFASMIGRRELPDSHSWNLLFQAVETGHQFERAMSLLESMRKEGKTLPVNEITYGALLSASTRVNRLMSVLKYLKTVKNSGVQLSEEIYSKAMDRCRDLRCGSAAIDVFVAMKTSGLSPGARTYTSLLQALSTNHSKGTKTARAMEAGRYEGASTNELLRVFLVFGEMRSNGIQPDVAAYNALINSCAEAGDLDRALSVLEQMYEDEHCALPDAITFTSLIKAASNAHNVRAAEKIFADMQQRTNHFTTFCQPSEKTFKHIMNANLNAGNFSRVVELWDDMLSQRIRPTKHTAASVLMACRRLHDLDRALAAYGVIRAAGIRLNNHALLSIVRLCEENDRVDLAKDVLRNRSRA